MTALSVQETTTRVMQKSLLKSFAIVNRFPRASFTASSATRMGIESSIKEKLTASLSPLELNVINDSSKARLLL